MKKLLPLLSVLFLISVGFSQNKVNINNLVQYGDKWFKENDDQPFSGIVFDMDRETGNKILEFFMSNGIKNGRYKKWYKNGELEEEGFHKSGLKNGKWRFHFRNGTIKGVGSYLNNNKVGEWIYSYENGQKWFIGTYKDKLLNGLVTQWYENGQKKSESYFILGIEDGLWTEWYENGKKKSEVTYENGKKICSSSSEDTQVMINSLINSLENWGVEEFMDTGIKSYPDNPFDVLVEVPECYVESDKPEQNGNWWFSNDDSIIYYGSGNKWYYDPNSGTIEKF